MMNPETLVKLKSSAYENGHTIGTNAKKYLQSKIKTILSLKKKSEYKENEFSSRVRDFTRLLKKVSPSWLDEAKGLADGARISCDDLLLINCLPPDFFESAGMNCTSFIKIGKKENILFKIRDERNWAQHFAIKKNGAETHYQYGVDIGNLGVAHFFNSMGVSGANNTGSESKFINNDAKFNDCHLLRYFAENCRLVDDAPDIFGNLVSNKAVGGAGLNRGMIFLFADQEKGLVMECTSEDCVITPVDKGVYSVSNHYLSKKAMKWDMKKPSKNTLVRKQRIDQLLDQYGKTMSLKQIMDISRDRKSAPNSMCNDDKAHCWMTLSSAIQVIDRKSMEMSYQLYCCGNTRNSFYLPLGIEEELNYLPLLSGDFYHRSDILYRKSGCGTELKNSQKSFEREVIQAVKDRKWSYDFAEKAYQLLKEHVNP